MPRASWNGFLRLSLVTCPVYLAPATTESKRIRFNQLNAETGNRLEQQLIDAETGEVVERDRIAKGYEYSRGQYVTVDDEELKALQIESSKIIDLAQFVSRDKVDPVYLDTPYYVHPDGELAAEAFQVIGEAMAAKGLVGIGRVTIASRERLVLVEPHNGGLLMFTMRSADEVRAAEFSAKAKSEADADMVAVAETIIERRKAKFARAGGSELGFSPGRSAKSIVDFRYLLGANGRSCHLFSCQLDQAAISPICWGVSSIGGKHHSAGTNTLILWCPRQDCLHPRKIKTLTRQTRLFRRIEIKRRFREVANPSRLRG
jgi:DNA end-binding protein Ku